MTTISDMENLAARIKELRDAEAKASAAKKLVSEELEQAENSMMELLIAEGKDSYRSNVGLLSISARTSVRLPQTDEDKKAFFDHLKSVGLYERMVTVNSATLNSFYKAEFEAALQAGNVDFSIPGIKEVTLNKSLSFRRA